MADVSRFEYRPDRARGGPDRVACLAPWSRRGSLASSDTVMSTTTAISPMTKNVLSITKIHPMVLRDALQTRWPVVALRRSVSTHLLSMRQPGSLSGSSLVLGGRTGDRQVMAWQPMTTPT